MDSSAAASLGFIRVAAVTPESRVADVSYNVAKIAEALEPLAARGCQVAIFPELCITGYTCADLFYQSLLLDRAQSALTTLAATAGRLGIATAVGVPIQVGGRIYNCAAFLAGGRVVGVVPKTYLPTTHEFYEERWFTSAGRGTPSTVSIAGEDVPFGADLLFAAGDMPGCVIGIEICEDLWTASPPSGTMAVAGATIFLNPSASPEWVAKADYRRELVKQQSARCMAGYLYAGSGAGESTTDLVYSGHSIIAENGVILAETERFQFTTQVAIADLDLQRLTQDRLQNSSFSAAERGQPRPPYRTAPFELRELPTSALRSHLLRQPISRTPFVPPDPAQRAGHCREIFNIQATGLARRLRHTGINQVTLGVSGGLDSTLALVVAARAFDRLSLARKGIVAITMPGLGTTSRTHRNAERLATLLGVTLREIRIHDAIRQHFKDIGHDENVYDLTYENAQARERTQILMDAANQLGGLEVGTGDLSELALGWCTYNGDQMSMYHVNAGVPKTLVRYLVQWAAEEEFSGETSEVLRDIYATPITPELLPLGEGEKLQQETEVMIGPYVLHDFFLYYTVRYAFSPRKVLLLAQMAFHDEYSAEDIVRWLDVFYRRFFANQFKRSAMPDGPKVGSVALSPRGDWRMPSDASSVLWLQEVQELKGHLDAE